MIQINLLPRHAEKNNSLLVHMIFIGLLFYGFFLITKHFLGRETPPITSPITPPPINRPVILWKGYVASKNDFLGLIQLAEHLVPIRNGSRLRNNIDVIHVDKTGAWLLINGKREHIGDVI